MMVLAAKESEGAEEQPHSFLQDLSSFLAC